MHSAAGSGASDRADSRATARSGGSARWFPSGPLGSSSVRQIAPHLGSKRLNEHPSGSAELKLEGVYIAMGRPRIAHDRLGTLQFSRVVLMPHLSRRGPTGIWEL